MWRSPGVNATLFGREEKEDVATLSEESKNAEV